jgi:hypothetical protein
MARVLLVLDPDSRDSTAIAPVLERHHHTPEVVAGLEDALRCLAKQDSPYSVVVIDLSRNRSTDWQRLDDVLRMADAASPRPMLLCFSNVYHGPAMKLKVERLGARFVWI